MDKQPAHFPATNKPHMSEELSDHGTASNTPFLEWLVGLIGLTMVVVVIIFLLYQGLTDLNRPPEIYLKVNAIQPVGSQYLVIVKASNRGDETVKGLVIEGKVIGQQAQSETSTLTFDYVPAQSEHIGGLFFSNDPRGQKIELRAQGYEQP
jgi:uncharacterized protein (TIGR02588 family)